MPFLPPQSSQIKNYVLSSLDAHDFGVMRPYLQAVALSARAVLHEQSKRIEQVTFIESGLVSKVALASGNILETAMVGYQGFVGVSAVLGTRSAVHRSQVVIPGSALRISADDLDHCMNVRPRIRDHLIRYVEAFMIHNSQTALCCIRHSSEQRLACWLCLACDALEGARLPVTHDWLSNNLGLRRAGVTEALIRFEEQGLVRKSRGAVQVLDYESLCRKACCCHGIIAKAYDWKSKLIAR